MTSEFSISRERPVDVRYLLASFLKTQEPLVADKVGWSNVFGGPTCCSLMASEYLDKILWRTWNWSTTNMQEGIMPLVVSFLFACCGLGIWSRSLEDQGIVSPPPPPPLPPPPPPTAKQEYVRPSVGFFFFFFFLPPPPPPFFFFFFGGFLIIFLKIKEKNTHKKNKKKTKKKPYSTSPSASASSNVMLSNGWQRGGSRPPI